MEKNIHSFIIGSSVPVFIITYTYLIYSYISNNKPKSIPITKILFMIPIIYGLAGIINYHYIKYSYIVGALFGLILSIFGRYIYNLPVLIFNLKKNNEYKVHIIAIILYSLIFQFILSPIQKLFI
jgi:hypothetical protein